MKVNLTVYYDRKMWYNDIINDNKLWSRKYVRN